MSNSDFHTTHWTAILAAKQDDTQGRSALHELCVLYQKPIRCFIERTIRSDDPRRYGHRDAEDLTQDFLAALLGDNMLIGLERREGKFRSYLLGTVKHFLSDLRKREQTERRGGDVRHVAIQADVQSFDSTHDAVFDQDWARSTIDRAVEQLGNTPETQALLPWLSKEQTAEDRLQVCHSLAMSDTAVKVALHRLRKKFRRIVRELVAQTVESDSEIDAELAYLIEALHS